MSTSPTETKRDLTVRVWVPDVWEVVSLEATPTTTFSDIKTRALQQAVGTGQRADATQFLVKYRGALITDETQPLGAFQVPDRAPMIVIPAHRRPVL